MAYRVNIYSFTDAGHTLSDRILKINEKVFRGEKLILEKEENNTINEEIFKYYSAHVFIGAVGIAVRKIAPYISDKKTDSAVIVIDEKGQFVIPVLSGHMGGANDLACLIAKELNAAAVLTTATDVNGYNAIDTIASRHRLTMEPEDAAKTVNSMLLKGEKIKVKIGEDIDTTEDTTGIYEITDCENCDVVITNKSKYIIGIGCRKNTDCDVFEKTLDEVLNENNIAHSNVDRIASIDLKENEEAIVEYVSKNKIMFETYTADELNSVTGDFDESEFVKEITGVSNVSERACVYAGNMLGRGKFILKRKAVNGITVSIYKVVKRINLNGKA